MIMTLQTAFNRIIQNLAILKKLTAWLLDLIALLRIVSESHMSLVDQYLIDCS